MIQTGGKARGHQKCTLSRPVDIGIGWRRLFAVWPEITARGQVLLRLLPPKIRPTPR
jgi:hypothetical protein